MTVLQSKFLALAVTTRRVTQLKFFERGWENFCVE